MAPVKIQYLDYIYKLTMKFKKKSHNVCSFQTSLIYVHGLCVMKNLEYMCTENSQMQNWGKLKLNQHTMIIDAGSENNYLTKVNNTISNET